MNIIPFRNSCNYFSIRPSINHFSIHISDNNIGSSTGILGVIVGILFGFIVACLALLMVITHRRRNEERHRSREFSVHELSDEDNNNSTNDREYDLEGKEVKFRPDIVNGEFSSAKADKETNDRDNLYATSQFSDEVSYVTEMMAK